jgi:hypothetical protein
LSNTYQDALAGPDEHRAGKPIPIRIVRLNADHTRRAAGSFTAFRVAFELSGSPAPGWRDIFGREWKNVNPDQDAEIDRHYLVTICPLRDIASVHLPALQKAVASTNLAYALHVHERAKGENRHSTAWKEERKTIKELAQQLQFE